MQLSRHDEPEPSGAITWDEIEYEREVTRFEGMRRNAMIPEIISLQSKLWRIEHALNVPLDDRVTLSKGWMARSHSDLAHLGARVSTGFTKRDAELRVLEMEYGKADDLRKQFVALNDEYSALLRSINVRPTCCFPRGFRSMNSYELQGPLKWIKGLVEDMHKREAGRIALAEQHKADAERAAARRAEELAFFARIEAVRKARLAEIEVVTAFYKDMADKIKAHPVLRMANVRLIDPRDWSHVTHQLGTMSESDFRSVLDHVRGKVVAAKRALREPLRRAWQSAQSRGVTRLDFEAYLKQEGFGSLLTF